VKTVTQNANLTGPVREGGLDRRDGRAYVMTEELSLAVAVALATGRPLLLRGDPGSGKSSLAAYIAQERNWHYYEQVVTSRTLTEDLLWTFDPVRRFAEASIHAARNQPLDSYRYVMPGVLWWAFDRASAARRGRPEADSSSTLAEPVEEAAEPFPEINKTRDPAGVVVLIDEIDKADPDVPNSLLVPLGSGEFTVKETNTRVKLNPGALPRERLIVITTNEERELPQAFLRRCVTMALAAPSEERLVKIATEHLTQYEGPGSCTDENIGLAKALARELNAVRAEAQRDGRRAPSTAEYLDALYACRSLGITAGSPQWQQLTELTLRKGLSASDS
jgi:MoxR-like ATPase